MRKTFPILLLVTILLIFLSGCSQNQEASVVLPTNAAQTALSGLNDHLDGRYAARFEIQFQSSSPWLYRLQIRSTPPNREYFLHMEGLDQATNPGDVRIVTDGATTWMVGEGTDNECIQFPNNSGMDPTYILPGMLVTLPELNGRLGDYGDEMVAGKSTRHMKATGLTISKWTNASIDTWHDPTSQSLTKFILQANGDDPYFGTGSGTITAHYEVETYEPDDILPVDGCGIPVLVPESAQMYVRLPGLASFESTSGVDEIVRFYQEELSRSGWTETEPPAQAEGVTQLNYSAGTQQVTIQIEAGGPGSKVKLLFYESQ